MGFQKGNQLNRLVKNKVRMFGDKNPAKRPEVRLKISLAKKGKMSEEQKLRAGKVFKDYNLTHKRDKHYNWKLDRSTLKENIGNEERRSSKYSEWRKRVYERDSFKCKINSQDCKGRIEVHHILSFTKYPELKYEINNGISLCHKHHPRKRKEEASMSPYFQELIKITNY
jgi:hypothetical protein